MDIVDRRNGECTRCVIDNVTLRMKGISKRSWEYGCADNREGVGGWNVMGRHHERRHRMNELSLVVLNIRSHFFGERFVEKMYERRKGKEPGRQYVGCSNLENDEVIV